MHLFIYYIIIIIWRVIIIIIWRDVSLCVCARVKEIFSLAEMQRKNCKTFFWVIKWTNIVPEWHDPKITLTGRIGCLDDRVYDVRVSCEHTFKTTFLFITLSKLPFYFRLNWNMIHGLLAKNTLRCRQWEWERREIKRRCIQIGARLSHMIREAEVSFEGRAISRYFQILDWS